MAFSQEVRFKIGGDTSGLKASFSQATSMAEAAGKKMEQSLSKLDKITSQRGLLEFRRKVAFEEANTVGKIKITTEKLASLSYQISQSEAGTTRQRKLQLEMAKEQTKLSILRRQEQSENLAAEAAGGLFGGVNLRQVALRAIGGAVTFALERAINYNASRNRVTEAQGDSNARGVDSLRATFAAIGGLEGQLTQGFGAMRDLVAMRDFQKDRSKFLSEGIQGAVSFIAPEELEKSDQLLAEINAKIQEQHNRNQLIFRDLERQRMIRDAILGYPSTGSVQRSVVGPNGVRSLGVVAVSSRARGSLPATERAALKEGNLNDYRAAQIEEERLRKVYEAEKSRGTPENAAAAGIALRQQSMQTELARRGLVQRRADVFQQLAGDATEGRTFANGRARPLSETERLARRAAQFRERARSQLLTGGGADAGRFMAQAMADEASVGNRLAAASAGVAPKNVADATSLKPEIARSNQILESINKALENVDVD